MRGADIVIETLRRANIRKLFTLSGNLIMPVFDAALASGIELVHVRHEAAAVHMADAWARMTGEPGVALVTGGAGHANAIGALCTASAAESPLVLLSGHASLKELGLGAFQELRQTVLAEPVTKASWAAATAAGMAGDIARAIRCARSGRPGPVHVSLPFDILEDRVESPPAWPDADMFDSAPMVLAQRDAQNILTEIASASHPLIVAPPALCTRTGRRTITALQDAIQAPVVVMESPRGINDPSLGAYSQILAKADLIVLLGKQLDFTLCFGRSPPVHPRCRWIVIEPDRALDDRIGRIPKERLIGRLRADAASAAKALIDAAQSRQGYPLRSEWLDKARGLIDYRPVQWRDAQKSQDALIHPAELCRQLHNFLHRFTESVFVSDGGEIGQWAQALINAPDRLINGVAGAIGAAIPFAIATKMACPDAAVLAVVGDGSFGFHMAEFDTAARYRLPAVVVVGNDSRWNAEYQIQLREYGPSRAHNCMLASATRYDLVASALGGHGEFVTKAADLTGALERAMASGKPACVNVLIESLAAPVIRNQL
jgi:acetolactate synthase-1/2/3 large subunit